MRLANWFRTLSQPQRERIPYFILCIAVFAVYANVYHNSFLLDDMVLIVENSFLRHWSDLPQLLTTLSLKGAHLPGGFYRPVQMLLYFFMYQLFGLSEAAFHGLNVVLQALDAGLMYFLGCRLGVRKGAAFVAALVWAIHPVFTEAVDCVSSTAEQLHVFFCLTGILVLLPDFKPHKFWLSGLLFILALGSKESAVVFPALATFTLFLVSKERLRAATYLRTWPLWLLMAAYVLALQGFFPHTAPPPQDISYDQMYTHNPLNRLLTSLATAPVYAGLFFWPANLHMERSFPVFIGLWSWRVLGGMVMAVLVFAQVIWGKGKRGLPLTWGLLWFVAAFSPYTGIVLPVNALIAEHWMYLPSIGLFLGLAQTAALWLGKKKFKNVRPVMTALVVLAAVPLGAATWLQNETWRDPVTFYEHIFQCGEDSGRAHDSLAQFYFNTGDYDKAETQSLATLAHPAPLALAETMRTHMRLAFIYLDARPNQQGLIARPEVESGMRRSTRLADAIAQLERAVEIAPHSYWPNEFLAIVDAYRGDKEKAAFYSHQAEEILRVTPDANRS